MQFLYEIDFSIYINFLPIAIIYINLFFCTMQIFYL